MSRQLMFNNANAVPASNSSLTNPADVAEARIAVYDADNFAGGTLALDEPIPEGVERLQFVQGGRGDNDTIMSPVFNVEDIKPTQVSSQAYVAPIAQVTTVTAETGENFAYVRVVQVNTGFKPHQRITVEVKLDGKSAADIATELANKINKARPNFVTATTSTADLILTGNEGVSFETSTEQEAEGWDVVATTTPNFGTGTAAQLAEMEEVAYGANFTNRIYLPINPPSYAANSTYDLFTIKIPTNTTPNISKSNKYHELRLAVQATASGIDLEEFFFGEEEAGT